jgi:hypothetical protein
MRHLGEDCFGDGFQISATPIEHLGRHPELITE